MGLIDAVLGRHCGWSIDGEPGNTRVSVHWRQTTTYESQAGYPTRPVGLKGSHPHEAGVIIP